MHTATPPQKNPPDRGCVLVTGAAGLLGRELVGQFRAQGWETLGVDLARADSNTLVGDLARAEISRQACAGVDVVVHAAARQYHSGLPPVGRRQFFAQNEVATRELLAAATDAGVRHFVLVSSDMSYGIQRSVPIREDAPQHPIGPYGQSKVACERLCLQAASDAMKVTIFRPRLIIGPGRLGVLKTLFDRIQAGRTVYMIGGGANRYQMVAVSDVADGCVRAVEQGVAGVYNLGSHDPPTVRALLEALVERAGSSSKVRALPASLTRLGLAALDRLRLSPLTPEQYRIAPIDFVLDTTAAERALGWKARFDDAEMLWSAYRTYTTGGGVVATRTAASEAVPRIKPPVVSSSPTKQTSSH